MSFKPTVARLAKAAVPLQVVQQPQVKLIQVRAAVPVPVVPALAPAAAVATLLAVAVVALVVAVVVVAVAMVVVAVVVAAVDNVHELKC